MSDQEARFVIAFDGKSGTINNVLAAIKGQVRSAVTEIESTTSKIDAFKGLDTSVSELGKKFLAAQDRAAEFRREIAQLKGDGKDVGTDLVKALKQTEAEITRTSKAYGRQADALASMKSALSSAGVDVSKLAAEELRLADALKKANAATAQQSAKDVLGLTTLGDVAPKLRELQTAFNTLRTSGKLTSSELATAQQALRDKVDEVRASVGRVGSVSTTSGTSLAGMFSGALAPVLGITAAFTAVVSAISAAIGAAKTFANEQAKLSTITTLSKEQLDAYGLAVRGVARTFAVDLTEAQQAFFNLVREGIGEPQALIALQASAQAAKASFGDLNVTAKVGADLMSAYGMKAEELDLAFDKLFTAMRNDGPTLAELAPSIGPLALSADAAGMSFDELVTSLNVMTSASGDAAGSAAALQKILVAWNTGAMQQELRELNVESDSLFGALKKIGDNHIPIQTLVDLGVATTRSAKGVQALTRNSGELDAALQRNATAANAQAEAIAKAYDSPAARSKRFSAELEELSVTIGQAFGTGSALVASFTERIAGLNKGVDQIREVARVNRDAGSSFTDVLAALFKMRGSTDGAAAGVAKVADATKVAADQAAKADKDIKRLSASFDALSTSLVAGIQSIQSASAKSLAEAQTLADTQIAALDKSAGAISATAAQTLAIQNKLSAERLTIITANEAAVTAAIETAAKAREQAARNENKTQQQISLEVARIRVAALEPVLAQYVDHYNRLVTLAQNYKQRVDGIEQSRIAFNEGVEKTLFDIRIGGLSALDQYAEKIKESERLIAKAREEGAKGNIAAAEKYTQEAIALSSTLQQAVRDDGTVIISGFDAQQKKIEMIKKAGEGLNAVYTEQGDAARDGAAQTIKQINSVLPKLDGMRNTVAELNAEVAKGVALKVGVDAGSFAKAEAEIARLTRDRTVTVTVDEIKGRSAGGPVQQLMLGGTVGDLVQAFAGGGHVFRRPSWAKVPGSGNGDTVPAALQAGSFVVRKAASRYYGDGLMGRLAQGLASGGFAGKPGQFHTEGVKPPPEPIRKWLEDKWGYDPFADPKSSTTDKSFQGSEPPISFDSRQVPEELVTARNVLEYAREMLNMVGVSNPLLGSLGPSIQASIAEVEGNPSNLDAVKKLLQMAETIGANPYLFAMWGRTQSSAGSMNPEWFVDWLAKNRAGDLSGAAGGSVASSSPSTDFAKRFFGGNPLLLNGPNPLVQRRFAAGGSAGDTDTVPAMLTPGEYVIKRAAASKYGAGLLHAINNMDVPRQWLANIMTPPPVRRFADGGSVGNIGIPERGLPNGGSVNTTVTINANPGDILSADNVRRWIIPVIDGINRRTR